MDDDLLQGMVEEELIDKLEASAWDINVQVKNNNVFLHGVVDVFGDKVAAEKIVRNIPGIQSIENGLTIAMEEGVTDSEIKEAIEAAFYMNEDQEIKALGVGVYNGTAYLVGTVKNVAIVEKAKEVAAQIIGVKEVISQLKIASTVKEDVATLTNSIARALANSGLNINEVDIDVIAGKVILQGWARSEEDKLQLAEVVKNVTGVEKVKNNLQIRKR